MARYQRAKIYKISSNHTNEVFIGATTETRLTMRYAHHLADYRKYLVSEAYDKPEFKIIQYNDAHITLVEEFPCENIDQLKARKLFHETNTPNCINHTWMPINLINHIADDMIEIHPNIWVRRDFA